MEEWKLGYHRAILEYLAVKDFELIDLYSVEAQIEHSEGYHYSEYTYEDPYTTMRVQWKDPETGRTAARYLESEELIEFLRSL